MPAAGPIDIISPKNAGQQHNHAQHHGQGIELHHTGLQRPHHATAGGRNSSDQIHQAIDQSPIDQKTELGQKPHRPNKHHVVNLIEKELAIRQAVERTQRAGQPRGLALVAQEQKRGDADARQGHRRANQGHVHVEFVDAGRLGQSGEGQRGGPQQKIDKAVRVFEVGPHRQRTKGEDRERNRDRRRRLVGMMARFGRNAFGPMEGEEISAEGIDGRQEGRDHADPIQQLEQRTFVGAGMSGRQDRVLAPKAGPGKDAGQGQAAEQKRPVRDRHQSPQSAEAAHVDRLHGVHHAAGAQEQQGLEEGMGEQVEHAGANARQRTDAEGQKHIAQLTDRGISQHPLEVGLRDRNDAGHQGRERADRGHDVLGAFGLKIERRAAGHHVNAGRDHRSRVNQRADRRGAFHRIGQPDVQRKLGALAAGTDEQQQPDGRGRRPADVQAGRSQPRLPQHAG